MPLYWPVVPSAKRVFRTCEERMASRGRRRDGEREKVNMDRDGEGERGGRKVMGE